METRALQMQSAYQCSIPIRIKLKSELIKKRSSVPILHSKWAAVYTVKLNEKADLTEAA